MKPVRVICVTAILVAIKAAVYLSAAPAVGAVAVSPSTVPVNVSTSVLFTAEISDSTVIATGVNLLRTDASGRTLAIVGRMYDDGTNGDAVAGDRIFSLRTAIQPTVVGPTYYRVSAAFRNVLLRALSSLMVVNAQAASTPPTITVSLSPAPNAAGWNNTPVTAHFVCTPGGAPIASCPSDQVISADGTQTVSGTVTDTAGGSASVTSAPVRIDRTPPTVIASLSADANGNGWHASPVTVHFTCNDSGSGIATCPQDVAVSTDGANQGVSGTGTDVAGNPATALANVSLDQSAPVVAFAAGADTSYTATPTLTGSVSDTPSGVVSVTCNGLPATIAGSQFQCAATLTLGPNTITALATDRAGHTTTTTRALSYVRVPTVTLTAPAAQSYFNITPTTVSGTVDDPTATVRINSVAAPVVNGQFSIALPIAEGPNVITATATNTDGAVGTASVEVTLDTTPPHASITSPADGFVTSDATVTIAGIVNDLVVGTVNDEQAQVTVNGTSAQVANRTFLATSVPLVLGVNVIQAVARDRVGNAVTTQISVVRQAATQPRITLVSGNGQSAVIGTAVSAPLVIALLDSAGQPVPNTPVIFKVTQNDGLLRLGSGEPAVTVMAITDANGRAQAQWTLGNRAGAGGNVAEAYSVGFDGTAIFTASGTPGTAGTIVVDTGNDQIGAIGQALPKPFIAVVVDAGHNRLPGVPVTFTVRQGGGTFEGLETFTTTSDSDGRVAATLTLGLQEGNANNLVEANFPFNTGFAAAFTASGRAPGNPAATTIHGVVLDNSNLPIPGVMVRAVLTTDVRSNPGSVLTAPSAPTDAEGQFTITGAPIGLIKLMIDGSTAEREGTYPSLEYDIVTVAGQRNDVGQPIYLLPLNTANSLCVTNETGGGTLTIPEAPGFSLTFGPGQVTFPGGSKSGCISVTVVNGDKVPMVPGFGQQPRFIVTIQPAGAVFNPPAPITIPNVDGLAPREVTEMYSFDHDIGSFVAIGTGVVSDDGQVIRSSQGVGVLKAGWHCGGNPTTTGTAATCPECQTCQGTQCVTDDSNHGPSSCCFQGSPVGKFNQSLQALNSQCPNKTQVTDAEQGHMIDGCSLPGILAILTPNLSVQDPVGGSFNVPGTSTTFGQEQGGESNPIPTAGDALNLPCNQHDICYQTCGSSQAACDTGMYNAMVAVCNAAYPSPSCPYSGTEAVLNCVIGNPITGNNYFVERAQCFDFASIYKWGLDQFGAGAWEQRQTQFCKCCP